MAPGGRAAREVVSAGAGLQAVGPEQHTPFLCRVGSAFPLYREGRCCIPSFSPQPDDTGFHFSEVELCDAGRFVEAWRAGRRPVCRLRAPRVALGVTATVRGRWGLRTAGGSRRVWAAVEGPRLFQPAGARELAPSSGRRGSPARSLVPEKLVQREVWNAEGMLLQKPQSELPRRTSSLMRVRLSSPVLF